MPASVTTLSHLARSLLMKSRNNAGVPPNPEWELLPFHRTAPATWNTWIDINLYGVLHCVHAVMGGMTDRGHGRIITIVSDAGRTGEPLLAVYSAAKAGLLQVMRVLALAGAVRQIRANAVLPGVVATDMLDAPRHLGGGQDQVAALRALHPLGRLGTPGDVARSIVYLLDSPWITGTELVVDGGLLIHP